MGYLGFLSPRKFNILGRFQGATTIPPCCTWQLLPCLKAFALSRFAQIDESSVGSWTSSIGLNFLLREFIAQLPPMEELCLDVQDATFILPAIVRHGKTLRKLEFGGAIPGPKTKRSMIVKEIVAGTGETGAGFRCAGRTSSSLAPPPFLLPTPRN
jgi:hypothetical protein